MRRLTTAMLLAPALAAGCAVNHTTTQGTLADLRSVRPDVRNVTVEQGLDQAMRSYRRFLEETPETAMTPEAMRRLADLQLEKQFGIRAGDGRPREMAAPVPARASTVEQAGTAGPAPAPAGARPLESDQDFERRTTANSGRWSDADAGSPQPGSGRPDADPNGALEAIALASRSKRNLRSESGAGRILIATVRSRRVSRAR